MQTLDVDDNDLIPLRRTERPRESMSWSSNMIHLMVSILDVNVKPLSGDPYEAFKKDPKTTRHNHVNQLGYPTQSNTTGRRVKSDRKSMIHDYTTK